MAIHKLNLNEFDQIDYRLIAIHTILEDYRLAYLVNQHLFINLVKTNDDILFRSKEGESNFSKFYFFDEKKFVSWSLIQNKNEVIVQNEINKHNLFSNSHQEIATKMFLIPELKNVDYFIKIENDDDLQIDDVLKSLKIIKSLSAVYVVETNTIKSKNNLIF